MVVDDEPSRRPVEFAEGGRGYRFAADRRLERGKGDEGAYLSVFQLHEVTSFVEVRLLQNYLDVPYRVAQEGPVCVLGDGLRHHQQEQRSDHGEREAESRNGNALSERVTKPRDNESNDEEI